MTIHTFEVSAMLTNENYYKIQEELKLKDRSKWKALTNGMEYWGLSDKGILINMHQVKKKGFYSYYIIYRISARRVIDNDNFVGLFNIKKYNELEEKVNEILKDKCSYLPKLKKCKLKRLDFCINAKLDNQEQVKAYIKTVKRANIPPKLKLRESYDKTAKRKKPTKGDFTVNSDRYIEISIYNKYHQMKNEKIFPTEELEKSKNIVRIEIRCMEGKIKELKKQYNIKTIKEFMSMGNKIGKQLYEYYLGKICNKGCICTLKEVMDRIDLSEYKSKNIALLKEFVKDANESRSVAKTLNLYKTVIGDTKVNRIIYMLDNIDTNFVTVTNSDVRLFDNSYIPTPLELYKEFAK